MWDINRGIKVRNAKLLRRMVDARDDVKPEGCVRGDGEISIDLLELMHKKAFNRRRLSSPTISDDYPIAVLREREVQKSRGRATTFKVKSPVVAIANVRGKYNKRRSARACKMKPSYPTSSFSLPVLNLFATVELAATTL